jgi:hypothetical protein
MIVFLFLFSLLFSSLCLSVPKTYPEILGTMLAMFAMFAMFAKTPSPLVTNELN